jgi:uncharacterized protein (TIGR01244 family)
MHTNSLDQQVSVSGQVSADDIAGFIAQGVEVLVCNRPDNEVDGQPSYAEIAAAAQAGGLAIVNIPFTGGQMQAEQAQAFAELVASGKRIHAYCRTGNRSTQLWAAAQQVL